jgi:hypothetical protein
MTAPAPNPGEQVGQLLYQLLYVEVLQRVLRNARDGSLVPARASTPRYTAVPARACVQSHRPWRAGLSGSRSVGSTAVAYGRNVAR